MSANGELVRSAESRPTVTFMIATTVLAPCHSGRLVNFTSPCDDYFPGSGGLSSPMTRHGQAAGCKGAIIFKNTTPARVSACLSTF